MSTPNSIQITWALASFEIVNFFVNTLRIKGLEGEFEPDFNLSFLQGLDDIKNEIKIEVTIETLLEKEVISTIETKAKFSVPNVKDAMNRNGIIFDFFFDLVNETVSTTRGVLLANFKQYGYHVMFPTLNSELVRKVIEEQSGDSEKVPKGKTIKKSN